MIFSIAMGAEYLSYVKFIATEAPTFFGYMISVLASVQRFHETYFWYYWHKSIYHYEVWIIVIIRMLLEIEYQLIHIVYYYRI